MKDNIILRILAKLLVPLIILFAFYVQFHGDYSPGGGFQAGVIFSASFILYTLIFGIDTTEKVIPEHILRLIASLGVLVYAGTGVTSLFMDGEFLNYSVLSSNALTGQHVGIILVELGVGLTVSSIMLLIFLAFANRGRPEEDAHD
ncbi:MAG: Na(+)/H(+) antiporter subunit B [Gammaproteobacteria bacterium]|nr:MAG: Na(+)/H(+) antiporter subunit B [Gammaproteobacteria bacterium]